jgi:putative transposase
VNLTLQLKLLPSPEQAMSLLATMVRFNVACGVLAAVAFANRCANKVELQKLAYHDIRRDFDLSAQMTTSKGREPRRPSACCALGAGKRAGLPRT